jgi:protein SCO1
VEAVLTGSRILIGGALTSVTLAILFYLAFVRQPTANLQVFARAPEFALVDQLERPVRSSDFGGKVVLADFIYTSCTDICPILSARMQALQSRLRQDGLLGSRVNLLSFTVDPVRDTPAVLRSYAERHQADPSAWRFLTGPQDELIPLIVNGFYLGTQALPPRQIDQGEHQDGHNVEPTYEVMHSGRFVLIDRDWQVRAYYEGSEVSFDRVVNDVQQLMR